MKPFKEGNDNIQALLKMKNPKVVAKVIEHNDESGHYFNLEWEPTLPIFTWGNTVEDAKKDAREAFELTFEEYDGFLDRVELSFKVLKLIS